MLWRVVGPPPAEVGHRTGPHAPGSDRDSSSSLLGDEESGSLAPEDTATNQIANIYINTSNAAVGVGQRAASVNQQPIYVPKNESVELGDTDRSVVDLPV